MTLLFMDGFDHYTTLSEKWDSVITGCSISAGNGRNGDGLFVDSGASHTYVAKSVNNLTTVIVGFAMKWASISASANYVLQVEEPTFMHMQIRMDNTGVFSAWRAGSTNIGTASSAVSQNVWTYVEIKITIHDTAGEVTIKLDGTTTVLNLTNVDTRNSGTGIINSVKLGAASVGSDIYYDDVYICDTAGTLNNDFLGDVKVTTLYPNGNGNYSQWAGSDGNSVDNYLLVDEADANTSDYIQSSTVNQKDTFTYQDVGVGATIKGVQICSYVKKSEAGNREVRHVTRVSATDYNSTAQSLGSSYKVIRDIRETDPSTAVAWTEAGINGAEFGIELTL